VIDEQKAAESSSAESALDLTSGQPPERLPEDWPLAVTPPFNPHRVQERVRTGVAAAIVGAVILENLIIIVAYVAGRISAKDLPAVTTALITPLVGVAGTVLGFYFGSHRGGEPPG
jgi:hypothetical protein